MRQSVATRIHETAIVDPTAQLDDDVEIGPYAIIGPSVRVGAGTRIMSHAVIVRDATIGERCEIHYGAVVGGDPQDKKYEGEHTVCMVGNDTVIREYATISRGTRALGRTQVGDGCLLMAYVHVAHDCQVGDGVILSNSVGLAGHVHIDDKAIVGGMSGIHQFTRVGAFAFVGGMAKVIKDIPPYVKADGVPARLYGLNNIGLQRAGFSPEVRAELRKAYRLFFRSDLNVHRALERAHAELAQLPEVQTFVRFIEASERGVAV